MRIVRHTRDRFVAEDRPLLWGLPWLLVALAALLAVESLARGEIWQALALALALAASASLLAATGRTRLSLDREANLADLRSGRDRVLISVDALMRAEVRTSGGRTGLAIDTALRDLPIVLAGSGRDAEALDRCARHLNAWLGGETAPECVRAAAPMLDSAPLLT